MGGHDVVPALLRPGEMVLTPERADQFRTALYQPQLNGRSLLRQRREKQQGFAVNIGLKDVFTGSEAVDYEAAKDRADWRSGGLL